MSINDELKSLDLDDPSELKDENENQILHDDKDANNSNLIPGQKIAYKDRKLEHKLKKYEAIIKKLENVNRITGDSQFLFIGNCGVDNNISYSFLEDTFSKYGKLIDIVMPKKKSYAFLIYENVESTKLAIQNLQSQIITINQTPICFYLFPVDKVPEFSSISEYEEINNLPDGLIYIENFIDDTYANKVLEFVNKSNSNMPVDLKRRKVKHYGYEFRYGSNDCDEAQQLTGEENKMPPVCDDLIDKMLNENLIKVKPDQLTVNIYEPGHGIGPHLDNVNAFDEYIISLSLISSVVMEFRNKNTKKLAKLYLKPNSLVVLTGASRYEWNHSIPERKHDIFTDPDGHILVNKRNRRISLTFRKVKPTKAKKEMRKEDTKEPELVLPSNDFEALKFERSYVHTVYNEIADHFSHTRHSAWPGVAKFIDSMQSYSFMLDVGCGNGKYLNLRKDLFCFGCDYSDQLIRICNERNFNCFVSDCLKIPCKNEYFDYVICIAVLHHLSTMERRIIAIKELTRILKIGGRALITVWAKEQKYKEKESYYISTKKKEKDHPTKKNKKKIEPVKLIEMLDENLNEEDESNTDTNIHKFGKEFQKKDLFVSWNYNPKTSAKSKTARERNSSSISEELKISSQLIDESVNKQNEKKEPDPENKVYLRYYHVFENQELESLFKNVNNVKIIESFYEQGNWCVIYEKTSL